METTCDFHRLITAAGLDLGLDIGDASRIKAEQIADGVDGLVRIIETFRNDIDAEVGTIGSERGTIAIKQPSPARRNQRQIDSVAFGFEPVFLVLGNRDVAHAHCQKHADAALNAADNNAAAIKGAFQLRCSHRCTRGAHSAALSSHDAIQPLAHPILRVRASRNASSHATKRANTGYSTTASKSCGAAATS